jgi:hypothetical protein
VGDGVIRVRDGIGGGEERVVCLWSWHGGGNGQRCGKKSEESEELHLMYRLFGGIRSKEEEVGRLAILILERTCGKECKSINDDTDVNECMRDLRIE